MIKCAGAIAVVLAVGCNDAASKGRTVVAGSPKASDTMTVDTTVSAAKGRPPEPAPPAVDSLVGLAPDIATPAPHAAVVNTATDTASIVATADELASLAAGMIIPVEGVVTSQLRDSYVEPRGGHAHQALDIMAPRGTPVVSATDGRVLRLFNSVAGGTMIYAADPSDKFILMYAHLDRYADGVVDKMPIKRGQLLGYVGSTGDAAGGPTHLHFAIARGHPSVAWWKGTPVNPYPLLVRPLAPDATAVQTHPIAVPPPQP